ncbi:hypothetical protein ACFV46_30965 [Streptomyces sp. NPDC059852]|uniref:hypothetical protein n=1 Tax=Streptomyces sp. NPDC059852 TaxID=3346972 RepID=UPI003658BD6F
MSRETDTPSSGPDGRGGAAYPSGTPPYGTPVASESGAAAARSGAPEERKTETTLTTRIRINIPGSRPIPPVVVRKPVSDSGKPGAAADTPEPQAPAAPAASPAPAEPAAEPAAPAEEKASDWFAPRKSPSAKGPQSGPSGNGTAAPTGSGPSATGPKGPGAGSGRPGGVVGSVNVPGARTEGGPRPSGGTGTGLPGATGGPVAPGHGGGTGSFDVTEALAAGPRGGTGPSGGPGARPPAGEARRDDLPYFSENGSSGPNGRPGPNGNGPQGGYSGPGNIDPAADFNAPDSPGGPGGIDDFNGPNDFGPGGPGGGPQGPTGPTTGPVTGDGPPVPPLAGGGAGRSRGPMGSGPAGPGAPGIQAGPGRPGPAGPGTAQYVPGGGLSDDTAILTPQKHAPEPGHPHFGVADNVSGHTVTSGIPVVSGGPQGGSRGPGTGAPEPAAPSTPAARAPKKKGRSKLALLGGGLVVLAGGLYGAGLLMNHTDVPKGTTVLGVDIGGGTRDDAVKKLDDAFEDRVGKPLKLSVGGRTVPLDPDKAGLQFDMQQTVSDAASSDYNPVSVIGSLFGNQRVVEPVMPTDEEKLHAALQAASGGSGSVTEGTVSFKTGKAVAVYGKPGAGIDVARSTSAVEAAYRTQVETGRAAAVQVPTTTRQPTVGKAEVDRFMKEFAEPAMATKVTIQTDAAHSIQFGSLSLPKILGAKAVDGKLVDTYDLKALKTAYGTTFAGVQINGASGKRDVLPEDVASALRKALRGKTPAERTVTIDTDPN